MRIAQMGMGMLIINAFHLVINFPSKSVFDFVDL